MNLLALGISFPNVIQFSYLLHKAELLSSFPAVNVFDNCFQNNSVLSFQFDPPSILQCWLFILSLG